jgi:hypothetical protein
VTVKIDTSSPEGLHATLEGLLSAQSDTQVALAKLAGPGITTEAALEGSGVAAFRSKAGGLRLAASTSRQTVEHEGETYVVESTVPGLLDRGAEAHLSAGEAATVAAYRETLGELNACKALGVRALPSQMLGRLMHLATGAPASMRSELTTFTRGRWLARCPRRCSGTPRSPAPARAARAFPATSGLPTTTCPKRWT